MPRIARWMFLCAALPLAGCSEPGKNDGAAAEATVRAVVYQVWVVEGAMDMIHGGGRWIREIYLPDANLSFNVEEDRLNFFVPEATRYDMLLGRGSLVTNWQALTAPPARRLGEIQVRQDFVDALLQLLKQRAEALRVAKGYFPTAPQLEK
ncbi:MAG: hypothetical protein FD180_1083 [Planctomycetota bacterium]|nr:MAG: hypothetical protein FD180_1083 [Planctomycetota bacterium]